MILVDYIKHLYLKWTKKRIDYDKYLNSKHWKRIKEKALKRAKYKCALCSYPGSLQVHHNNYKCLYWEKKSDITVLCRNCHARHHRIIDKDK